MKVLLTHNVKDIGRSGDTAEVSDGYARNFLFPRKLAVLAQEGNLKLAADVKRKASERDAKIEARSRELAARLEGVVCTIKSPSDPSGNLYGSVTDREVAQALEQAGIPVDRRQISMDQHIKKVGDHSVMIRISGAIEKGITVRVVPGENC
ncbi:MAG TPA: 50S ribosomal protein L9 [Candidatus Fermentibacter sp.]|nr:50S ribosomal protein L9 [Candidatus Fermentibacter sp.]